jgi:hypothetical protein
MKKTITKSFPWAAMLLLVGCGAEGDADVGPPAGPQPDAAVYTEAAPVDIPTPDVGAVLPVSKQPNSLRCVSEADPEKNHEVIRVVVGTEHEGTRNMALHRGPMFHMHEMGNRSEVDEEVATLVVQSLFDGGGSIQIQPEPTVGIAWNQTEGAHFSLNVSRVGRFFFGALRQADAGVVTLRDLTCWDPVEIFGSGWADPGSLEARFDWATGNCLNDEGEKALNDLPIEFVRETGHGACADLRGVSLNGDDFGYPTLSWWNLQGALLDGATLYFADLNGAALHGAKAAGLSFGYARLDGSIDDFTELPEGQCEIEENPWGGATASCIQ